MTTAIKIMPRTAPEKLTRFCRSVQYIKLYEHFVPSDIHIQSKAETYTVEGYNSLFRHFLARLRRKTKCYSKSKKMLLCFVILLMLKWNDGLSAILN